MGALMAATETNAATETKKSSKIPMIAGALLALVGAGGGFYAVQSGLIPLGESAEHAQPAGDHAAAADQSNFALAAARSGPQDYKNIAFVPIEPLVISLGTAADARHLRFRGQIEAPVAHAAEVEAMMPRIVDVLNSYLRAVQLSDLERPAALVEIRTHMLRRIQIVMGKGRVNDLLVMEFVLN